MKLPKGGRRKTDRLEVGFGYPVASMREILEQSHAEGTIA